MPETRAGTSDWALDCLAERLGATRNVATARRPRAVFIAPPVAWVTTAVALEEWVRANQAGSAVTQPSFHPRSVRNTGPECGWKLGVILQAVMDPTEGKGTDSSRWEGPDLSEGSLGQGNRIPTCRRSARTPRFGGAYAGRVSLGCCGRAPSPCWWRG